MSQYNQFPTGNNGSSLTKVNADAFGEESSFGHNNPVVEVIGNSVNKLDSRVSRVYLDIGEGLQSSPFGLLLYGGEKGE